MSGMPANSLGVDRFVSTSRSSTLWGLVGASLKVWYVLNYNIPSPLHSIDATGILESHEGISLSCWAVHILQLSKLQRIVVHHSFLDLGCQGICLEFFWQQNQTCSKYSVTDSLVEVTFMLPTKSFLITWGRNPFEKRKKTEMSPHLQDLLVLRGISWRMGRRNLAIDMIINQSTLCTMYNVQCTCSQL